MSGRLSTFYQGLWEKTLSSFPHLMKLQLNAGHCVLDPVKQRNGSCYLFLKMNTEMYLYSRGWGEKGRMSDDRKRNEEVCSNS